MNRYEEFEVFPEQPPGAFKRGLVPLTLLAMFVPLAARSRAARVVLGTYCAVLLRSPQRWEGAIIVIFKKSRGLTTTDLAGLAGLCWVRRVSRRQRSG